MTYCTVSTVLPLTPFKPALIVVVPRDAELATPDDFTTATAGSDELQATWLVILMLVPSLNFPWALNCCEAPRLIDELGGVTAIDTRVAFVIVRVVLAFCPWNDAAIVVLPVETPVATPSLLEALLTVATEGAEEVQVTTEVRSSWLLSANIPVAVNGRSMVSGTLALCGVS